VSLIKALTDHDSMSLARQSVMLSVVFTRRKFKCSSVYFQYNVDEFIAPRAVVVCGDYNDVSTQHTCHRRVRFEGASAHLWMTG